MKYPDFIVKINDFLDKINLNLYTVLLGIGIIVLIEYVIYAFEKKNGYSRVATNKFLLFIAISLVAAYFSALFFDAVFHYFQTGIFKFETITYIGGFIGGIVVFVILVYCFYREERKNIVKILNIIIPGVVLAHACGRLGCFTAGCCYGRPTNSIFGIYFPAGTNAYIDGLRVPVHPTQLYEVFFLIVFFFVLVYVPKVKDYKFSSYLIGYGIFRFILEKYFRGDRRGLLFNLPPSLILSIVMVAGGIGILIFTLYQQKTKLEE
ncbi:MAG: prolipoprotein diacylglyceryl transferase [Bacilli bacterium]|nr:prolipoprotein diacylglyceryl transferase [Bacilli bacterium]